VHPTVFANRILDNRWVSLFHVDPSVSVSASIAKQLPATKPLRFRSRLMPHGLRPVPAVRLYGVDDSAASNAIRVPARLTDMPPRRIRNVSNRHRLITVSLSAQEFNWLTEFVAILESAGYRRARSAVVSVALAELRGSIGKAPPHEVLKYWLRRDTKRLIAAIDGNRSRPPKVSGRQRL